VITKATNLTIATGTHIAIVSAPFDLKDLLEHIMQIFALFVARLIISYYQLFEPFEGPERLNPVDIFTVVYKIQVGQVIETKQVFEPFTLHTHMIKCQSF